MKEVEEGSCKEIGDLKKWVLKENEEEEEEKKEEFGELKKKRGF